MKYLPYILIALLILLLLLASIFLHFKKKRIIQKVKTLTTDEKNVLLDNLAKPFGFLYEPHEDIFATTLDAPQKLFGYKHLYDLSAPYFNMIFDYETIYFDYNERTWLIEIWKGQYGISAGCELGIYCANTVISPEEYCCELFHAVDVNDMLEISLQLNQTDSRHKSNQTELGYQRKRHWWLTIFKPGKYTRPANLSMNIAIRFKNYAMQRSFHESFRKALPDIPYKINGLTLYFLYSQSNRKYSAPRKLIRRISLFLCHLYCNLFNFITRPFEASGDKILYLYYYLPAVTKRLLKSKTNK